MNGSVLSFRRVVSSLFCQSGTWKASQKTYVQSGKAYTSVCGGSWMNYSQRICNTQPHIDIVFAEPMQNPPQIMAGVESNFPFTSCSGGASDAVDHSISNVTQFGFRLRGGSSPTSGGSCGTASSGRAVSLFAWIAVSQN